MTNRTTELASKILAARDAYYNTDLPVVSDAVFDAWIDELKTLDPTNAAVIMIGAPLAPSEWKKAKHKIPMGSLDKVNTPEELSDWAKDKNCNAWFVVEKLDGISIECVYEHGKLVAAITRGAHGIEGEDITVNVARMQGVNNDIKTDFNGSLRGEIVMRKSVWKSNFPEKSNPRNAASGVSKRLDGVGVDKLDVMFYQVIGDVELETEEDQFAWLESHYIDYPNFWSFDSIDAVSKHWREYQDDAREALDYDIDGLVIRVSDLEKQAAFGEHDMRPKGAIAFKFDNAGAETVIREFLYQVGNMGRITPVAVIDPVMLVGARVERASVYNLAYINELGLDVGATVLAVRANDVIPRIEALIKGTGTIAQPPTNCPECNTKAVMQGEYLTCINATCPARVRGAIHNWINELNVLEWGDSLIAKLVELGVVKTVSDLYRLSVDDLSKIDRMGKKSATNCYNSIWSHNPIPLEIFIGGLSIPMIGSASIKLLMDAGFDTLDKLLAMSEDEMRNVKGMGPARSASLYNGLKLNREMIGELMKSDIKIQERIAGGKLDGLSFAFTGAAVHKRDDLEAMVERHGGTVKSVGKTLTYLVIADPDSRSSKALKARTYGCKLISESELFAMCGEQE